jgi:hypothetical protein
MARLAARPAIASTFPSAASANQSYNRSLFGPSYCCGTNGPLAELRLAKRKTKSSWRRRLLWLAAGFLVVAGGLMIAGYVLAQSFEPFLKDQTAAYLRKRFGSELDWSRFRVRLSMTSPLRVLLEKGRGAVVRVELVGVVLRHRGRIDIPPLIVMPRLNFEADLSEVMAQPAHIRRVAIQGLSVTIPPTGERPSLSPETRSEPSDEATLMQQAREAAASVIIDRIDLSDTVLRILPKDRRKDPLQFDIHELRFAGTTSGIPLAYTAVLENALPPGHIASSGTFGPWNAAEPGDSPLTGEYTFRDADLGVFKGIAGILSSTGNFTGQLNEITVDGETDTPKFALASGGTSLPLHTKFHAVVDGTNGNTQLEPVEALLNTTRFTARGAVTRDPKAPARSIALDVKMEQGRVEDMLLLAVKSEKPTLEGDMRLNMKLELLPRRGTLAERLRLNGRFELLAARFGSPEVQEKIDGLSRRGLGKPGQKAIAKVPSDFMGNFHLEDRTFAVKDLQFDVPGAIVELDGNYRFGSEALDFHGKLRLQARLSKTMTGWKRVLLTPVDPFFAKEGYGTVVNIQVTGTRNNPQFGLDRGRHDNAASTATHNEKDKRPRD